MKGTMTMSNWFRKGLCLMLMVAMVLTCATVIAEERVSIGFVRNEEQVIFDENGVKMSLTGEVEDNGIMFIVLEAIIENNTTNSIYIVQEGTANGWATPPTWMGFNSVVIPAGAKAKSCLTVDYEDCNIKSFRELESLDLRYEICNSVTNESIFTTDSILITFDSASNQAQQIEPVALKKGSTIDLDFVTMKVKDIGTKKELKFTIRADGIRKTSGIDEVTGQSIVYVQFLLKNLSKSDISIQATGEVVIGDYTYRLEKFVCNVHDTFSGNLIAPLNEAHCVFYAHVPKELLGKKTKWAMAFGFSDGFESTPQNYQSCDYQFTVQR